MKNKRILIGFVMSLILLSGCNTKTCFESERFEVFDVGAVGGITSFSERYNINGGEIVLNLESENYREYLIIGQPECVFYDDNHRIIRNDCEDYTLKICKI